MKIKLGELSCIMQNNDSMYSYFGWPTVAKLQNGKIAVSASGFRVAHCCPFGKAVISFSEDNGHTYTMPAPVIDTPLDDRDSGLGVFGKSGLMLTSFNNRVDEQKQFMLTYGDLNNGGIKFEEHTNGYLDKADKESFKHSYLKLIDKETEEKYVGSTFKISNDCGVTFGKLQKSPITSPHGPIELSDGKILWVGTAFGASEYDNVLAYLFDKEGNAEFLSEIPLIYNPEKKDEIVIMCEPHAVEANSGKLICHIRVHFGDVMTLYQTVSTDKGKTWTAPVRIIDDNSGGPAHLLRLKNGNILCSYGERSAPFGVRIMISEDEGETWKYNTRIYDNNSASGDLGYPSTVELENGELLTVFYARERTDGTAKIYQRRWRLENED